MQNDVVKSAADKKIIIFLTGIACFVMYPSFLKATQS